MMMQQPDQFHTRVYVRLPFSDKYLENEAEAEKIRRELHQLFAKPLLKKSISAEPTVIRPDSSLSNHRHGLHDR